MKSLLVVMLITLSASCMEAERIFFPGRALPKFKPGTLEINGFYADSDSDPIAVPESDSITSFSADDVQERRFGSFQGRPNVGFFSSRFQATSNNLVQFVDYVTVTKVEPPLCVACTCLKSGVSETCVRYGGRQQATLTATLNTGAAVVTAAEGCIVGIDGMTLTCSQAPVTFVIMPTFINGIVTVAGPTATAGTLICPPATASPITCTYTDANGLATTLTIPYTLGAAGIAVNPAPIVDNTAVACTVGAMGSTLSCTYTPPLFITKVTVTPKPEVLASVSGSNAKTYHHWHYHHLFDRSSSNSIRMR